MVNFIIYENNKNSKHKYEMIIFNLLGRNQEKFHIFDYNSFNNKPKSRNIYILSSKSINKIKSIENKIRKNDSWTSQIIVITNKNNLTTKLLDNKNLVLNYINKTDNIENILKETLCHAYKILTTDLTFNFSLNGEIHKINYKDILYIEKSNNQNYCTIHTINQKYTIKETISNMEATIESACFMKTHRSCIVNLENIKNYKISTNIITFINNYQIDLIARDKRSLLKDKLIKSKITQ